MRKTVLSTLIALTAVVALVQPVRAGATTDFAALASVTAPTRLHVALTGKNLIRWAWDEVPGATSYRIAVSTSPTFSNPRIRYVSGQRATFTDLRSQTYYFAYVRAWRNSTASGPSAKVSAKTGAVSRPAGQHVPGTNNVLWRWSPYVGADKYQVQQSSSPTFANIQVSRVVTWRRITLEIEPGSYGFLRVRALDSARHAISGWSPTGKAHVPG